MKLTNSLLKLLNNYITIMTELHVVGVDGVDLPETNNPNLIVSMMEPEWSVIVKNGDYSCMFGPNDPGSLPAFDKSLVTACEQLSEFIFEEDVEEFMTLVNSFPGHLKEIQAYRDELNENDSTDMNRQVVVAMLVSKWNSVVRWLEDAEVVGVDDDVTYTPSINLDIPTKILIVDNGAIGLSIDFNTNSIQVTGTNLEPSAYAEVALKDEGRDDAMFHINEALTNVTTLTHILTNSL